MEEPVEKAVDRRRMSPIVVAIAGLCVTMLVQIGSFVWWAATITEQNRGVMVTLTEVRAVLYTKGEAEKDFRNVGQRIEDTARRLGRVEDRVFPAAKLEVTR